MFLLLLPPKEQRKSKIFTQFDEGILPMYWMKMKTHSSFWFVLSAHVSWGIKTNSWAANCSCGFQIWTLTLSSHHRFLIGLRFELCSATQWFWFPCPSKGVWERLGCLLLVIAWLQLNAKLAADFFIVSFKMSKQSSFFVTQASKQDS